jgi:hypothetical protein
MASCPTGSEQLCTTNADCTGGDICRAGAAGFNVCRAPRMFPDGGTFDGGFNRDAGRGGRDAGPG